MTVKIWLRASTKVLVQLSEWKNGLSVTLASAAEWVWFDKGTSDSRHRNKRESIREKNIIRARLVSVSLPGQGVYSYPVCLPVYQCRSTSLLVYGYQFTSLTVYPVYFFQFTLSTSLSTSLPVYLRVYRSASTNLPVFIYQLTSPCLSITSLRLPV